MRSVTFTFLFAIISSVTYAQINIGLNLGLYSKNSTSSTVETLNGIQVTDATRNEFGRLLVGLYMEHGIFSKGLLKHEFALFSSWQDYTLSSPPGISIGTVENVSIYKFTTINYRGLIGVFQRGHLAFLAGPSIDFNILTQKGEEYTPYPAVNELITALNDSFNPATLYLDFELRYRIKKRVDIIANYKTSLTSATREFKYQDGTYGVNSRGNQFSLRLGYLFLNTREQ